MTLPIFSGLLTAVLAFPVIAQDASRTHQIDNDLVQVSRRVLEPSANMSAELPPALIVFLADHKVRLTTTARTEERRGARGGFVWHLGGKIMLENLGEQRLELVAVAPKFSPAMADLSKLLSVNGRNVVFENDLIHVKHLRFRTGQSELTTYPSVDHVLPAIVIHLTVANINLRQANGRIERIRMKSGEIRFQPREFFLSGGNPPPNPSGENADNGVEVLRVQLKTGEQ